MILPPFELHRPKTVEEAAALKGRLGADADFVLGGTDLLCNYKYELNPKPHVISLRDVEELHGFDARRIGAATTLNRLIADETFGRALPSVVEAARSVASFLLRQTGTVGGNLLVDTRCFWFNQSRFWRDSIEGCLKSEGDVCRVVWGAKECVAVYSGDLAPILTALGASVTLASPRGRRVVPLGAFFRHDGIERHVLAKDEMLVDVLLPEDAGRWRAGYKKLRTRESFDFPVLGAAVALKVDAAGVLKDARVCLGAVHTTPLVRDDAVKPFLGKKIDEATATAIGEAVADGLVVHNNTAMTPSYRRRMAAVFTRRLVSALAAS
jgi:4-hydroxybenzoyl-CoA reductase subunit beta